MAMDMKMQSDGAVMVATELRGMVMEVTFSLDGDVFRWQSIALLT
jgi:hypothetical protein